MVKITYIDSGGTARTVEGEVGSTVMETAIKNSVPEIEAECGGGCACSTCHGYLGEGGEGRAGEPPPAGEGRAGFALDGKTQTRLLCPDQGSGGAGGPLRRAP